jgi:hypothetical protein
MSLPHSSIKSAYPLAAIVTRSGKSLGVVDGSALADCIAACDTGFSDITEDGVPHVCDDAPEVQVADNAGEDHSIQRDTLVDHASRAVAFTMDIARNHVNPKIKRIVDATEAYIDTMRSGRLAPLLIKSHFIPDVYDNADLNDLLSKHAASLHKDVPAQVISAKWHDQALNSGIGSFDSDIAKHFSGREEYVQNLWERYFSNVPGKYRSADMRQDVSNPDDALVLFLGAHNLLNSDEIPEGLDTDLVGYRGYLGSIKDQAGAQVARRVGHMKTSIESNQLVIDAPRPSRPGEVVSGNIEVNGDVYNKWLSDGGSPEALMGACLTGDALSYATCKINAADNSASWERHLNGLNAQAVFELRGNTIVGLRKAVIDLAKEIYAERGDGATFGVDQLNQRLASLPPQALDNLYSVARGLVCDLFFSHTDAKAFLEAYDDAAAKNAGMDAGEVALTVAIDYITHWVASSISVSGEFITSNN